MHGRTDENAQFKWRPKPRVLRVAWFCAVSVVLFCAAGADEVSMPPPQPKTLTEEVEAIVARMTDLETSLREDRTDSTVEIQGKEIEDAIDKLIKHVEEEEKLPKKRSLVR